MNSLEKVNKNTKEGFEKVNQTFGQVKDKLGKKVETSLYEKDIANVRSEMGGLAAGIRGNIENENSPNPKLIGQYTVSKEGVYVNFLDSNNQSISVTRSDVDTGIVYIVYDGQYSSKLIVPIANNGEVREGDKRGINGGTIAIENYLNKKKQTFESSSINKFDKNNLLKGFYIDRLELKEKEGALISNRISLRDNKSKVISISGLELGNRWAFHFIFFDKESNPIENGFIGESYKNKSIPYQSDDIDSFIMTVYSAKEGEVNSIDKIQIEFGDEVSSYEEFKPVIREIFQTDLQAKFASKIINKPSDSDDIVSMGYVERMYDYLVFKDIDRHFKKGEKYSSDSKIGWIRKVSGKINRISLSIGHNRFTAKNFKLKIGYTKEIKPYINDNEVIFLREINLTPDMFYFEPSFVSFNFEEIEIPKNNCLIIFIDSPICVPHFTGNGFDESDYMMLYQTASINNRYSYGYAYSSGIKIEYVENKKVKYDIANRSEVTDIYNKTIAFIADSITRHDNSWAYQAANKLKFNLLNLAISGARLQDFETTTFDFNPTLDVNSPNNTIFNQVCRLAQKITPKGEQIKWTHLITKTDFEIPTDIGTGTGEYLSVDVVVIAMATNDLTYTGENKYLEYIDIKYPNYNRKEHMVTGLMWAIESIKCIVPDAKIIISSPIQATKPRTYQVTKQKRDRVVEVAGFYAIPVIDSFYESGICGKFEVEEGNHGMYLHDGVHPNDKGKKLMGEFLVNKLKALI